MAIEDDITTRLKTVTARVWPDFAPVGTARPYLTYQFIGGDVINPLSNEPPGKRNAVVQVNTWADTRKQALALSFSIEDAMRAATAFNGKPQSAAIATYDPDVPVYGCRQDFSIWFDA